MRFVRAVGILLGAVLFISCIVRALPWFVQNDDAKFRPYAAAADAVAADLQRAAVDGMPGPAQIGPIVAGAGLRVVQLGTSDAGLTVSLISPDVTVSGFGGTHPETRCYAVEVTGVGTAGVHADATRMPACWSGMVEYDPDTMLPSREELDDMAIGLARQERQGGDAGTGSPGPTQPHRLAIIDRMETACAVIFTAVPVEPTIVLGDKDMYQNAYQLIITGDGAVAPQAVAAMLPATVDPADRAFAEQAAVKEFDHAVAQLELGTPWSPEYVNKRFGAGGIQSHLLRWAASGNTVTLHLMTSYLAGPLAAADGTVLTKQIDVCGSIGIDGVGTPAAHASEAKPEDCTFPFPWGVPDYGA